MSTMNETLQRLVRDARSLLVARQAEVQKEIADLQAACPHPSAGKEHKSNTGNYDPGSDCYWTEFRCPDCGKFWSEDGSK